MTDLKILPPKNIVSGDEALTHVVGCVNKAISKSTIQQKMIRVQVDDVSLTDFQADFIRQLCFDSGWGKVKVNVYKDYVIIFLYVHGN